MSFAVSIDLQGGGHHLEINHRLADFTSKTLNLEEKFYG